jgi:hypothetical protein
MKLDLGALVNETLDLTFGDEVIARLKKPGKDLIIALDNCTLQTTQSSRIEEIVKLMEDVVLKVLNNNTEGNIFDLEYLTSKNMGFNVQAAIFRSYCDFAMDFLK